MDMKRLTSDMLELLDSNCTQDQKRQMLEAVEEFVKDNSAIDDVFNDSEILDYCRERFEPEEVFDGSALEEWAKNNGWVKE